MIEINNVTPEKIIKLLWTVAKIIFIAIVLFQLPEIITAMRWWWSAFTPWHGGDFVLEYANGLKSRYSRKSPRQRDIFMRISLVNP